LVIAALIAAIPISIYHGNRAHVTQEQQKSSWYGLCSLYGANSVSQFRLSLDQDPQLASYFSDFDWSKAELIKLQSPMQMHVSYKKNGKIHFTRKKLLISAGETVITDGNYWIRSYCCNELSREPVAVSPDEPPEEDLQPKRTDHQGGGGGGGNTPSSHRLPDIPEPGTLILFGTGILGLAISQRKKFR
jgi:hypothetical protein